MNTQTELNESLNKQSESGTMYVAIDVSSADYAPTRAFRGFIVGVAGNVNIVGLDGVPCVLPNMVAGVAHACAGMKILSASTTATGIVAVS